MIIRMINGVIGSIKTVVIGLVTICIWSIALALASGIAIVVLVFLGEALKHTMR
jgi:hypothetical protein